MRPLRWSEAGGASRIGPRRAALTERAQQLGCRIELAYRDSQALGRDLDTHAGRVDRVRRLLVDVVGRLGSVRPRAEELDEIRVRERVEEPASSRVPEPDEVTPPRLGDRELRSAVEPQRGLRRAATSCSSISESW